MKNYRKSFLIVLSISLLVVVFLASFFYVYINLDKFDKNDYLEDKNIVLSDEDRLKIDFILLGAHDMFDVCYDHNTSSCEPFFERMLLLNFMTEEEGEVIEDVDLDNPINGWNPNYSERALNLRKDVLNRYFNYVKEESSKDSEFLKSITCKNNNISLCKYDRSVDLPKYLTLKKDDLEADSSDNKNSSLENEKNKIIAANTCDGIKDEGARWSCYRTVAKKLKDVFLCEEIKVDNDKNKCYKLIASAIDDIDICNKIQPDSSFLRTCYMDIINNKEDGNLCKNIMDEKIRIDCLIEIAIKTKDFKLCEEISDDSRRNYCYVQVAAFMKDISVCEKVDRSYEDFNNCYLFAATNILDCEKIEEDSYKNQCYLKTATNILDCEKIEEDSYRKKGCVGRFD